MKTTRIIALAALSVLASWLHATPAAAGATTSCVRSGTTLQIQIVGESPTGLAWAAFVIKGTPAGDIVLAKVGTAGSSSFSCGDATTSNIDRIEVVGSPNRDIVQLQPAHDFAPGASAEPTGKSEIEVDVELGASDDAFLVAGDDNRNVSRLGAQGANFNPGGGDVDVDVTFAPDIEFPGLDGVQGNDLLTATGGFGTGGPAVRPVVMGGSVDNDTVIGGNAGDWVTGASGNDTLRGGPGNDHVGENPHLFEAVAGTEVGLDKLFGGPGGDVLRAGPEGDRLDGGPGDDEEHGGDGDDVFLQGRRANGADLLFGGPDTDEAKYSARRSSVRLRLDNSANDGSRGELDSVGFLGDIENLTGGRASDILVGNNSANTIRGMRGDDELVGKGGPDFLDGGPGNDACSPGSHPSDASVSC